VKAGALDRRLTIQSRALTPNARGDEIASWSDTATVWANRRDVSGREFFSSSEIRADISTVFRIRHRDGVSVLDRVVEDGLTYDIVHIARIGRREGLDLVCRAAVP